MVERSGEDETSLARKGKSYGVSKLHSLVASASPTSLPRLSSLNGNDINGKILNSRDARGTIHRKNLNFISDKNDQQSHVHISDKRIGSTNGLSSPLPRPSSSPSSSTFETNNFQTDCRQSFPFDSSSGLLNTQKLDIFLDQYEEKFKLTPLNSEIHDLAKLDSLLMLIKGRNTSYKQASKIIHDCQTKSLSAFISLDASCQTDDGAQDTKSHNNGKDDVNSTAFAKKHPLSPIKHDAGVTPLAETKPKKDWIAPLNLDPKDSIRENIIVNTAPIQSSVTPFIRKSYAANSSVPNSTNKINNNHKRWDWKYVDKVAPSTIRQQPLRKNTQNSLHTGTHHMVDTEAKQMQKIPSFKASVAPQPFPQQNNNSENAIRRNVIESTENSAKCLSPAAAPEASPPSPRQPESSLFSESTGLCKISVGDSERRPSGEQLPRNQTSKSKIPIPLPKTKSKSVKEVETKISCTSSSKSSQICNNDTSGGGCNKSAQQVEQGEKKAEAGQRNDKLLKKPIASLGNKMCKEIADRGIPTLVKSQDDYAPPKLLPKSPASKAVERIGQGDEVFETLKLIDGLSGHTSWIMNKLLEYPVPDKEAMQRVKALKTLPNAGDFFGVPFIKREARAQLFFGGTLPN